MTITASNVSGLVKAWSYTLGGTAQFSTAPTAANGMIYIGATDHGIGSETGILDTLDAKTGTRLWSYNVGATSNLRDPTVANGAVYIGSTNYNKHTSALEALDAKAGTRLWSYTLGTSDSLTAPIVANGVVYIVSEYYSGNDTLDALDAKTGAKLWSYTVGTSSSLTAPVVANGMVYIGWEDASGNRTLDALDAKTGTKLWSYTVGTSSSLTAPVVANGMVYIGWEDDSVPFPNGTLDALDAKTGTNLWSYNAGSISGLTIPTVANGMVYIASEDASRNDTLDALDAKTSTRLWSYTVGTSNLSTPTIANRVVYIASGNDMLDALNATSGTKVWSYNMGSGFDSALSVANGVIYIDSLYYGKLSALDAKSGARLWTYFTDGSLESVTNTIVYVSSRKTLYAFAVSTRQSPTPTATPSSLVATTSRLLVPSINNAPVFANVPGLHIQSTAGLQCPLRTDPIDDPSDDLVFTTGRLTYSKDEIQQIRNYLHEMAYGSESLTTSYTLTPPPTLHWISGSTVCSFNLEISNTGDTSIQISSLGVQLLSAPQPNSSQSLHTLDFCSVADRNDADALGCGGGFGSGGGACGGYTVNIALKAAPAASIFAAAPSNVEGGCSETTLRPNDTIVFDMNLSSPGTKQGTVAPYIYAVVPVLTVTDANGTHTFTLTSMAGIAAFIDRKQITCYGLLHEQDTTFVPVSTFQPLRLCLAGQTGLLGTNG